MPTRIRVLLVEASPLALQALQKMLAASADIEVVGGASQGRSGFVKALQLRPDVLCLSTQLIDTLGLVNEVMSECCCPILILQNAGECVTDLLAAGAVDTWTKPASSWSANEVLGQELVAKIKRLTHVPVISRAKNREIVRVAEGASVTSRHPSATGKLPPAPYHTPTPAFPNSLKVPSGPGLSEAPRIIAVGASTGGPHALISLFSALPRDFPCPLLCVQHISKGFLKELVDWLDASCPLKIKIATAGEVPLPGVVYFGEEDRHLELDGRGRLWFSAAPPVDGHRPSVTTLFQSLARTRGKNSIAILLTGMGSDGARGMQSVAEAGGMTFAQEASSCVVFGMPKEAIALGAAQHVMKPEEIARKLATLVTPH